MLKSERRNETKIRVNRGAGVAGPSPLPLYLEGVLPVLVLELFGALAGPRRRVTERQETVNPGEEFGLGERHRETLASTPRPRCTFLRNSSLAPCDVMWCAYATDQKKARWS